MHKFPSCAIFQAIFENGILVVALVAYMKLNQLRNWLTEQLKLAEPLDSPSSMDDPNLVAVTATKKLGLLGFGNRELFYHATKVTTPQECAGVLIECISALPEETPDLGSGDLLTVNQAAARFNIGRRTIYRLVERGELNSHRVGSAIRIRPSDLEAYLEGQTQSESLFR